MRDFLRSHSIEFDERNIRESPDARAELLALTGELVVPAFVASGRFVVGFEPDQLAEAIRAVPPEAAGIEDSAAAGTSAADASAADASAADASAAGLAAADIAAADTSNVCSPAVARKKPSEDSDQLTGDPREDGVSPSSRPPGNSLWSDQGRRVIAPSGETLADGLACLLDRIAQELHYNSAKGESQFRLGMHDGLRFAEDALVDLLRRHDHPAEAKGFPQDA